MYDHLCEELEKKIRVQQCTINILHSMLKGDNTTVCNLHHLSELNNPHNSEFKTTRLEKNIYKIEW